METWRSEGRDWRYNDASGEGVERPDEGSRKTDPWKPGIRRPDYDCEIQEFFHLSPFLHERIQEFDTRIWVALSLSLCSFRPAEENAGERVAGWGGGVGLFPPPRPTPWISNRRRAARSCMHLESTANRGDAFRETQRSLYSSERCHGIRSASFTLFFFFFFLRTAHRIFQSARDAIASS